MPTAQNLRLRCFLEGIEVPIISAALSIQPDSPAQCSVQLIATDKGYKLKPRTLIHIFYYDYHEGPGDTLSVTVDQAEQVVTAEEAAEVQQQSVSAGAVQGETQRVGGGTGGWTPPVNREVANSTNPTGWSPPATNGSVAGRDPTTGLASNPFTTESGELPGDGAAHYAGPVHGHEVRGEGEDRDPSPESMDNEDSKWKTYFTGEIVGWQFVKSHNNRGLILQCLDLSLYWDTCYQYQVNVASLTGNGTAHFVGAGTSLFDTFFRSSTSTIVDVVKRRSFSRPELTGLMSGVVHLLERVGGVYTSRGFKGVNDFFSIAELRLHLVDMITASEHDDSSRRVFARRAFNRWTRSSGGRLGKICSFREILGMLNKFIYHNVIPNPMAMYTPPETNTRTRTRRVRTNLSETSRGREVLQQLENSRRTLARTKRAYAVSTATSTTVQGWLLQVGGRLQGVAVNVTTLGARSAGNKVLAAKRKIAEALSGISTGGVDDEAIGRYTETTQMRDNQTTRAIDAAINLMDDAIADFTGRSNTRTRTRTSTHHVGARVNSQIIRPDIFMVAPPRCNVLFPEVYGQMQFSRTFLREVSRMRLTVSDEIFGPDVLLNNVYYAPDVEVLGERVRQGRAGSRQGATLRRSAYSKRLMDHELYTGVVPIFERMNEVNIAAARSNTVSRRGAVVPYAARAAAFQFFKHRMAPRSMSITGKFNPYIAPGFPVLVIDRHMTKEGIEISNMRGFELQGEALSRGWANVIEERQEYPQRPVVIDSFFYNNEEGEPEVGATTESFSPIDAWLALRETVPTQFVGLLMAVNHTVSQSNAQTSYTLSTARTHRERDELLSANMISVSRRQAGQATRTTTVAALPGSPPRVGSLGPYYGLITEVNELDRSGSYMLYGTFQGDIPRRRRTEVPVGIKLPAHSFGPEVIGLVGSRSREVEFKAYQIKEEVDRWRGQKIEIPMEDFLRPPWMSEVWGSDKIGAVYLQFFGVGAITDPITVDLGENSFNPTEDREQQAAEVQARNSMYQDPLQADGKTNQNAELDITVERAADLLVRSYSVIRHEGMDAHEFVRAYTWRPIASLQEMLGSRDLQIDPSDGTVLEGIEGFHSRAFGRGAMGRNLRNLVPENRAGETANEQDENQYSHASRLLGISTDEGRDRMNLLTRLDKRYAKSVKVLEYVDEIYASRGLLG